MSVTHIQQAAEKRRSIYALNKQLPVPAADVVKIIEHAVKHTPSAFNSQSTRLVVLLGAEHEKLWQLTEQALAAIVPTSSSPPRTSWLPLPPVPARCCSSRIRPW